MTVNGEKLQLEISGEPGSPSGKIVITDTTSIKVKLTIKQNSVTVSYKPEKEEKDTRLTGWIDGLSFGGLGFLSDGVTEVAWNAVRVGDLDKKEEKKEEEKKAEKSNPGSVIYPFVAYGWSEKPTQETTLFKGATVWTMEGDQEPVVMDILVKNGRIAGVGKNLSDLLPGLLTGQENTSPPGSLMSIHTLPFHQ